MSRLRIVPANRVVNALVSKLEPGQILTNARVTAIEQDAAGVRLRVLVGDCRYVEVTGYPGTPALVPLRPPIFILGTRRMTRSEPGTTDLPSAVSVQRMIWL